MFAVNDPTAVTAVTRPSDAAGSSTASAVDIETESAKEPDPNPAFELIVPVFWYSKVGYQVEKNAGVDKWTGEERLSCVLMVSTSCSEYP